MFKFVKIFGVLAVLVFVGNVRGAVLVSRDHAALIAAGYVTISNFSEIQTYADGGGVANISAYNDFDFEVYNEITGLNEFPSSKFYFTTMADDGSGTLFLSAFDTYDNIVYPGLLYGSAKAPISFAGVPIEDIYGVNDVNGDNIIGYVNCGTGSLIFGGDGDVTIEASDLIIDGIRGNLGGDN